MKPLSFQLTTLHKYLIVLFFTIILGFNLASRSDAPPYGYPTNELSNNYWGIITDIGQRWRTLDFTFWNRGVGGGMSLFTSGQYPILNPTNIFALVLNDDNFYLFKLIEPYLLGFFFTTILLWTVFKTRWSIAFFGGMAYMGLVISKSTTMAESPYFLYGCGLFPVMVLLAIKLSQRHIYLAAAGVGACLALQFLGEGVTQLPQMLIWWSIFFTVWMGSEGIHRQENKKPKDLVKTWGVTIVLLWLTTLTFCGLQLIPSLHFFNFESARLSGHYPINNFPLFRNEGGTYGFMLTVLGSLVASEPIRAKIFLAILLVCFALSVLHFGQIFANTIHRRFFYLMGITLALYFVLPDVAFSLTKILPFLEKGFSPLTFFTFRYGLHTLDFYLILFVCLILNDQSLSLFTKKIPWLKRGFAVLLLSLVFIVGIMPIILFLVKNTSQWIHSFPSLQSYIPGSFKKGMEIFVKVVTIILLLSFRPRQQFFHLLMAFILLGSGFMMLLDCYKWYDKGCQSHAHLYQLTSAEHDYFRQAKGKYVLPYHSDKPEWILDNYNLLHGVHGTAGFMGLPPLRIAKFGFYYNLLTQGELEKIPFVGSDPKFGRINGKAPPALATYFPVDFTMVAKQETLPWQGFQKVIDGEKFDIYERSQPTQRVYFANDLRVMNFYDVIRKLDQSRSSELFVTTEDAQEFALANSFLSGLPAAASYDDFKQAKESDLSFRVTSAKDIFAIVPEMYQKGWQVRVDGHPIALFPANYLFLGFKVPAGEHQVALHYSPPWFWGGFLLNLICLIGLISLCRKFWKVKSYATL